MCQAYFVRFPLPPPWRISNQTVCSSLGTTGAGWTARNRRGAATAQRVSTAFGSASLSATVRTPIPPPPPMLSKDDRIPRYDPLPDRPLHYSWYI